MPEAFSSQPCRFCGGALTQILVDLGTTPLANGFLTAAQLEAPEARFPLRVLVCGDCRLAQVEEAVPPQSIFPDYAYFSSYSTSWLAHARRFAEAAIARFRLGATSQVVEVASNDGYLLRNFVAAGIPALGIEPAANVAEAARAAGVPTLTRFFGQDVAEELLAKGQAADLLIGNNVLAHVPGINDFVAGLARLLKPEGVLSLEFPHLLRLIEGVQFDTIYHEHYAYFSLLAAERILAAHGLAVFDLEELPTHGGSLRLYAGRRDGRPRDPGAAVLALRDRESAAGFDGPEPYAAFAAAVECLRGEIRGFLETAKREGKQVVAYGAAAKGNTLLNACGIGRDLIAYVVDANPHKQGRFTPGSHLPVHAPEKLRETRPDYVVILPWNLAAEIVEQQRCVRDWGGRFVVLVPRIEILA